MKHVININSETWLAIKEELTEQRGLLIENLIREDDAVTRAKIHAIDDLLELPKVQADAPDSDFV